MNNPSHLIDEDDIEFENLVTFQSSPHSINKKAIDTKLIFDAGHGCYSSRASINLYVLPNGSYTMAFELMWSSDDVDSDSVSLNGISAVETIHDLSNKTFDNYSRLIMQFSKSTDTAPNHLYIDIVIKFKSGKLYPPKLQTYLVCYGIKGLQSDVPSTVYDALWGVDNGVVTFNETINMGNNKVTGLANGTTISDAVNKAQLDALKRYYYFTNKLQHDNEKYVKFPIGISKYPFQLGISKSIVDNTKLRITLSGNYRVVYYDNYKNVGQFEIYDQTNGISLFVIHVAHSSFFIPITINAVIEINIDDSLGYSDVYFRFDNQTAIFDGKENSTFYIEYLGP